MNKSANVAGIQSDAEAWQAEILTGVSRTFALTIPHLPKPLSRVVTNAYLLCRIADTIEDESALSAEQKQAFHAAFVDVVAETGDANEFARELTPLLTRDASDSERDLIAHTGRITGITSTFNPAQRAALNHCLGVMCSGMPRYERQASVRGLADMRALDQYCYYVAGVVGETLTELFCDYSQAIASRRDAMVELGVSFGQGLQMTNILKDFWEDRRRGVCWLPHDLFARAGIDLGDLRLGKRRGFSAVYAQLIGLTHGHLRKAFEYTLLIPDSESGIRRFCLIALGLAVQTLQSISASPDFASGSEVKVSRRVVQNTVIVTRLFASYDRALRRWFTRLARGLPFAPIAADWSLAKLRGDRDARANADRVAPPPARWPAQAQWTGNGRIER